MFIITFTEGPIKGREIDIDPDNMEEMVLGRERGCAIRLRDPHVSGKHCKLSFNDDKVFIVSDLGSQNGTLVNGQRISEPVELNTGDICSIGKSTFVVKAKESMEAAVEGESEVVGGENENENESKAVSDEGSGVGAEASEPESEATNDEKIETGLKGVWSVVKSHAHWKDPWAIGAASATVLAIGVGGLLLWKKKRV